MTSDTTVRPKGFFSLPASTVGRRSVLLAVLFGLLLASFMIVAMPRASEPILWVLMGLTVLSGLSALGVGLWAIVRDRERSWLVWLALGPGILVIFWTSMEVLFPH